MHQKGPWLISPVHSLSGSKYALQFNSNKTRPNNICPIMIYMKFIYLIINRSITALIDDLEKDLEIVTKWLRDSGLKVNEEYICLRCGGNWTTTKA